MRRACGVFGMQPRLAPTFLPPRTHARTHGQIVQLEQIYSPAWLRSGIRLDYIHYFGFFELFPLFCYLFVTCNFFFGQASATTAAAMMINHARTKRKELFVIGTFTLIIAKRNVTCSAVFLDTQKYRLPIGRHFCYCEITIIA